MVSNKITQKCTAVVSPELLPGEQIQMIDVLQLGKVSAKRQAATAAIVGVATAGMAIVAVRPRPYLIVFTDRRILLVDFANANIGKRVAMAVGRTNIKVDDLKGHLLTYSTELHISEPAEMTYRLSWGRAQGATARRVVAALQGRQGDMATTSAA